MDGFRYHSPMFRWIGCLSLSLGLLLFAPSSSEAQKWEKIIDDGEPGYSETGNAWRSWKIGNAYKSDYRYLSHYEQGRKRVGTATWQTKVPYTGMYEVTVHIRQTENRTTDADYKLQDGHGKNHHVVLDQKRVKTGWHRLGIFYWKAGQTSRITLDGTDDNMSDEADALKWNFVGAGSNNSGGNNSGGNNSGGNNSGGNNNGTAAPDCKAQNPGTYNMKLYAGSISSAGDWRASSNAKGAPDNRNASSPNVDAGDVLTASDWKPCTPKGSFQITGVKIGVLAKMQYDSGPYKLIMYLEGNGKRTTFSQTSLRWVYNDITSSKAAWTINDLNALQVRTGLASHPGGRRDSDAWVDAFSVEVTYKIIPTGGSGSGNNGPPPTCPNGQTQCGGSCVKLQVDSKHCGACYKKCAAGQTCQTGSCKASCPSGGIRCGNQCVNPQTDTDNCGQCGNTCPAGYNCLSGRCNVACRAPRKVCSGTCVDLQTNLQHCGACGKACPATQVCTGGSCQKTCSSKETTCSGQCVDINTNRAHCGGCESACKSEETCKAGTCESTSLCKANETECFESCVDLQNDANNCGGCGVLCKTGEACQDGQCVGSTSQGDAGTPDEGDNGSDPNTHGANGAGDNSGNNGNNASTNSANTPPDETNQNHGANGPKVRGSGCVCDSHVPTEGTSIWFLYVFLLLCVSLRQRSTPSD